MEMHQLRYFTAVARTGNFTRAAEQCHIAQPSLSQQIRKLEEELDEKLILRLPGGKSRLTPAGEILLGRANRILAEAQSAVEELRDRQKVISGAVRLGAIPTIAPFLIPEALLAFNAEHPQVELVVHEATTEQLLTQLERNELDFVMVSPPLTGGPWHTEVLGVEPLYLVVPDGNRYIKQRAPLLDDLREEEFILMREGHCLTGQVMRFCKLAEFRPRVRFLSAQVETLKALIRSGAGVSLLPSMALANASPADTSLHVIAFRDPVPQREIVFASLPDFPLPRAAKEFQNQLRAVFAKRQAYQPPTAKPAKKKPARKR
ncbi:LysR family transcriptional regulator [Cerasicoccus arenae]|uniref:LysR family transcriptional regulator n=1 Tax=Cerasicoccus arenae TaxID=424488 RepID=A0A8J3DA76_9BACT|nr:hydrogen peroxide-inducible genes activator [Cerasicoccus arenae]MBK1858860.1 LysR family transcriptional regulator [Cerasicoccus arenae]GHB96103.1 LysR family transcriptional regulator [Cerasicoccus arenae]